MSAQGCTVPALPRAALDPALDSLNLWYLFWIYDSKPWPKGTSSHTCSPRLLFSCCFKSSQSSLPPSLVPVGAELGPWNREDAESKSFPSYLPMLGWLHKRRRFMNSMNFHHPKGQKPCCASPGKGQMHQTINRDPELGSLCICTKVDLGSAAWAWHMRGLGLRAEELVLGGQCWDGGRSVTAPRRA